MRQNTTSFVQAGLVLVGLLMVILLGCNGAPLDGDGNGDLSYRIDGAMVIDLDIARSVAAISLDRNGERYGSATVTLDGRQLTYDAPGFGIDNVYSLQLDSVAPFLGRDLELVIVDGSDFGDTLIVNVADSFSIENIVPTNRLVLGAGTVSLEWTGSPGTAGYQITAVHSDSTYQQWGYPLVNPPGAGTSGSIPAEAFTLTDGINPDTGLYNLYVYSLGSVLDSSVASSFLPTPLAAQYSDNIDERDLSGLFGTVVVTSTDTVRVTSQN